MNRPVLKSIMLDWLRTFSHIPTRPDDSSVHRRGDEIQQGAWEQALGRLSRTRDLPRPRAIAPLLLSSILYGKYASIAKILILGVGKSGKSTLVKAMTLFQENAYTQHEREVFRSFIFRNLVQGMRALLAFIWSLGMPLNDQRQQKHIQPILLLPAVIRTDSLSSDLMEAIDSLWRDPCVQTLRRSGMYRLSSCFG